MGPLSLLASQLVQSGLSVNTRKSYTIAIEKLSQFRSSYNLQHIWPVPVNDLLNFIASLAVQNLSPSTVTSYLSGISYCHKIQGLEDTSKFFIVTKAIEGYKRTRNRTKDVRTPISLPILDNLIANSNSICSSTFEAKLFSAAFSLAFFALLRVSEFTKGPTTSLEDTKKQIQIHDVELAHNKIKLKIQWSKTDQKGKAVNIIIQANQKPYCPYTNLQRYLNIRPISDNTDLFIHFNHSSLTRYQFNSVLQKAIKFLGITGHYRTHSFRIGGATELAKTGMPEKDIMRLGRWKSHAYERYIRI